MKHEESFFRRVPYKRRHIQQSSAWRRPPKIFRTAGRLQPSYSGASGSHRSSDHLRRRLGCRGFRGGGREWGAADDCARGVPKLSHRSGYALLASRRTRSKTAPIESGSRDKRKGGPTQTAVTTADPTGAPRGLAALCNYRQPRWRKKRAHLSTVHATCTSGRSFSATSAGPIRRGRPSF